MLFSEVQNLQPVTADELTKIMGHIGASSLKNWTAFKGQITAADAEKINTDYTGLPTRWGTVSGVASVNTGETATGRRAVLVLGTGAKSLRPDGAVPVQISVPNALDESGQLDHCSKFAGYRMAVSIVPKDMLRLPTSATGAILEGGFVLRANDEIVKSATRTTQPIPKAAYEAIVASPYQASLDKAFAIRVKASAVTSLANANKELQDALVLMEDATLKADDLQRLETFLAAI